MSKIYIGTSGWSYKSWHAAFFPPKLSVSHHFDFYATQFDTVEINLTFYRLPAETMVRGWERKAPPGFVYAVKGSRFITHMKKLANLDGALDKFFDRIAPMRSRVGVLLWQLPPILTVDIPRLEGFLAQLPNTYRHAVEFRHPSWSTKEVFDTLRHYRAAHVSVSSRAMPMNLEVTSDIVYIRFHGLEGGFAHDYTEEELQPWSRHILRQAHQGKTIYAYFNNDGNVRAPANAKALMRMTGIAGLKQEAA